jgi:3-isopropylmalate/(R)-2-methylmalate dehydratase large subunit
VDPTPPRRPLNPRRSCSLQVKSAMTMTEKILARASERASLEPGENVWVDVDVLMTHDVCGPGTIGIFKKEFGANAKVWDPEKLVIIPDHYIFTSDERANRNVDILRDFCKEQDIKYFYDIKDLSDFRVWKHGCLYLLVPCIQFITAPCLPCLSFSFKSNNACKLFAG